MSSPNHQVQQQLLTEISEADALAIGELLSATWPGRDREERAEQLLTLGREYEGPKKLAPRSFVVFDKDRVIAHAQAFARRIAIGDQRLLIQALAKVTSASDRRGEGLGALVVQACFDLVDQGQFEHSFFQTSFEVEPFYKQLGCCRVESRVVNSLNHEDPDANPFWDRIAMRYPASAPWPDGVIDLLGPGY